MFNIVLACDVSVKKNRFRWQRRNIKRMRNIHLPNKFRKIGFTNQYNLVTVQNFLALNGDFFPITQESAFAFKAVLFRSFSEMAYRNMSTWVHVRKEKSTQESSGWISMWSQIVLNPEQIICFHKKYHVFLNVGKLNNSIGRKQQLVLYGLFNTGRFMTSLHYLCIWMYLHDTDENEFIRITFQDESKEIILIDISLLVIPKVNTFVILNRT